MRVIERTMFYGASRNTFDKARLLRNNITETENILLEKLKILQFTEVLEPPLGGRG